MLERKRLDLNYKHYPSSGPTLIIMHGLMGSLDNWHSLASQFAGQFDTYTVDLRNHGRSPHDEALSYPEMAADLAHFIEDRGLSKAQVIGHSMGGKVAMQAALTRGEIIEKLVCIDIAPKGYDASHTELIEAVKSIDLSALSHRKEAEEMLEAKGLAKGVVLFLLKNLNRKSDGGWQWKMNLPVIEREYEAIIGPIVGPLTPYEEPTLFVKGDRSDYIVEEDMPMIEELFPNCKLETIHDAGHWVNADQPDELYEVVTRFLLWS